MELYIRLQVQTIAAAFAMGCAAALLYDLLRTLRLARRRRTVTHLTDLVYVLAVGWAFLQFALAIGQGELRLYVLPCAALGAIFSWRVLVPLFRPIWQFWLGAAVYMGRLLWQPVRMLLHFCKKVWISAEKAIAFFKKWRTAAGRGGRSLKQAKRKKRRTPITLVVLLVLLAVVSVELIRVYGQLDSAKSQRETMSQELEQQKKENSALESDLSKAGDEEFIKGLAKDQLGLAEDGERIFYDVNH